MIGEGENRQRDEGNEVRTQRRRRMMCRKREQRKPVLMFSL